MKNKRGIELSINFIVILVISIVVFVLGIKFVYQLVSDTKNLATITFKELDDQIGDLICESSERVCISGDSKEVGRDQIGFFGIKIRNVLESQDFEVKVTRPIPGGVSKNQNEIFGDKLDWKPSVRTVHIGTNEEVKVGVGVYVPKTAVSGTYIFNVDIKG